jgi:hypothetical protein
MKRIAGFLIASLLFCAVAGAQTSTPTATPTSLGATAPSKLTIKVENAGNGKKGTLYFWIR